MARARPGLARAINDILERHGSAGKRLSFRQAERMTGLSPATIGELAKGNARTPETIRRFALGLDEDVNRLLLLAGFVPEEDAESPKQTAAPTDSLTQFPLEPEIREWLERFERALIKLPPGRERELFKNILQRDTELLENFIRE